MILLPAGIATPLATHGPLILGAVATEILPPVENRKYVPSLLLITDGSCELPQRPVQGNGFAQALATSVRARKENNRKCIKDSIAKGKKTVIKTDKLIDEIIYARKV